MEVRHADNQKLTKVLTLFIQYQGYVMNINRGKAFMICGMGALLSWISLLA